MTDADKTALGWYNQNIQGRYCQRCGACRPTCRGRVDFGELNRCLAYADGYGRMDLARAEHAVLAGGRGAGQCLDCADCTARCVHGIELPRRMEAAKKMFC